MHRPISIFRYWIGYPIVHLRSRKGAFHLHNEYFCEGWMPCHDLCICAVFFNPVVLCFLERLFGLIRVVVEYLSVNSLTLCAIESSIIGLHSVNATNIKISSNLNHPCNHTVRSSNIAWLIYQYTYALVCCDCQFECLSWHDEMDELFIE